ncbi:hypothetical protein [Dehalobacterium formicoaceticum]|uniref:Uncharacterized protein n=1 Tax=Dehalobacterium formicoaceticum TaxID=51515 RepID=A0ABT1Y798_9FIRM|nr:hypothetical protein [Dehalobacterium formicoaceticum]MCR6546772.1 hypothetical protein [Dehalobacterium formicoaceticum]
MEKNKKPYQKENKNQGLKTVVPENQNQNHNIKKEALGPNTKR